ncbi:MAG: DUF5752 family protein [Nanoarchaeota archaeon]
MTHSKTFHLKNGKKITDLKGLAKELKNISHDVFDHHVNHYKNDFSNWIKHSLKDEDLAVKIHKRLNKIEIELEVLRHLVHDTPKKKTINTKKIKPINKKVEKAKTSKKK